MAKGNSRVITNDGGSAIRSRFRRSILSSKDNMCVLLWSGSREGQHNRTSGGVIFQQLHLMALEKQVLDVCRAHGEEAPVGMFKQLAAGAAIEMEAKRQPGETLGRKTLVCGPFVGYPFE